MSENWIWTPVEEILQTINGSMDAYTLLPYGSGAYSRYNESDGMEFSDEDRTYFLARMIEVKANDSSFLHLVDSLVSEGWTSAIAWDPGRKYLGNGHHRLVAAILLGMDSVPTTPQGSCWSRSRGEILWSDTDEDDEYGESDEIVAWHDTGRWFGVDVEYGIESEPV